MGSVRVTINQGAFNALRNSAGVVALLEAEGGRILAAATANTAYTSNPGEPFQMHTVHNASRAVTFVGTANIDGMLAEGRDRALTQAIG